MADPGTAVKLNPNFLSPDVCVFFFGLLLTAGLHARGARGAILWGILGSAALAVTLKLVLPHFDCPPLVAKSDLMTKFQLATGVVAMPPSLVPTFCQMDLRNALSLTMMPFVLIFLFMNLFDTLGTLIGVTEQAGLVRGDTLPRLKQALVSDAVGTVAGAALGTSTVVSFIESASGVARGGRTGLTALVVAGLFLAALFFSPLIAMIGSYLPITAPALVVIGSLMIRGAVHIEWSNPAETIPSFLILIGIPLTYSIADGLALGFLAYPVVKILAGQARDVKWLMYVVAGVLAAYFVFVRAG
jgi:AGZA family xanthine/uracil permease-like MFS transporter